MEREISGAKLQFLMNLKCKLSSMLNRQPNHEMSLLGSFEGGSQFQIGVERLDVAAAAALRVLNRRFDLCEGSRDCTADTDTPRR